MEETTELKPAEKPPRKKSRIGQALKIIFLIFVAFQVHKIANWAFFLYPDQRSLLLNWQREFDKNDGYAKISDIYPAEGWDMVCVAASHSIFSEPEYAKYIKEEYIPPLLTPSTESVFYGLSFLFLKDGAVKKTIFLTAAPLYRDARWFVGWAGNYAPSAKNSKKGYHKIGFNDLNISSQNNVQRCYPRSSAYLKYKGKQDLSIGG